VAGWRLTKVTISSVDTTLYPAGGNYFEKGVIMPTTLFIVIFLMIIALLGVLVSWEYKKQQVSRTMRPNILLQPKQDN
jgi:hypothetical protein